MKKNLPKIDDAIVVFGNLYHAPVYATVGKNRINLVSFSGGGSSTGSLTQMLFRSSRITNASFAYNQDGLNTNITVFQTDDNSSNGAYGLSYRGKINQFGYSINGGYLYNINGTGNHSFDTITKSGNNTITKVGAVNIDVNFTHDMFSLGSGWAQTTVKSTITNNSYAGAWYVQTSLSDKIFGRPTSLNISYNGAYNTGSIPIVLSGSGVNRYLTDKTAGSGVNKMLIASVEQRPFSTENISLSFEYAYMHMYNHQHSNAYTLDISLHF
jgi:hypothetical protein